MKSDNQIQDDVMEEIRWDPILDKSDIGVSVNDGIVTLSGHVNNYMKKISAEKAAKRVKDVKAVAMDVDVRLGYEQQRNDTEIASAALNAIKWDTSVPDDKLKLSVEDGRITLEGQLTWQYQKNAAEQAVRSLNGVKGVINSITISQPVNTAVIKDKIRTALERNADVEAARIRIETNGNKVTLKGSVNSWTERRIAEQAAWSSPGVISVEDNLLIGA
jgi:osmotically-inducible protein OsmY